MLKVIRSFHQYLLSAYHVPGSVQEQCLAPSLPGGGGEAAPTTTQRGLGFVLVCMASCGDPEEES